MTSVDLISNVLRLGTEPGLPHLDRQKNVLVAWKNFGTTRESDEFVSALYVSSDVQELIVT